VSIELDQAVAAGPGVRLLHRSQEPHLTTVPPAPGSAIVPIVP
jgi:hypothetical protein